MPLYHGKKRIGNVNVKFEKNGVDTSDATITSGAQMLKDVTAYGKNGKITGTIPSQQANTITPNDNSQIAIKSGTYTEGDITVNAVPTETKNITSNGTYTPTSGKYFSSVSVDIPSEIFETQTKNVSPTESAQIVTPDNGYDGLSSVTIEAIPTNYVGSSIAREGAKSITPNDNSQVAISAETYVTGNVIVEAVSTETKNITENGTYTPTAGNYFSSVSVNIPEEVFETQSKTISPTESQQTVSPDANYDGLSSVVVNAIPSNYIGSGVTRQANKTITPTKSAQTAIQAGSYAEGAVTVEAIPSEYIITSDATATDADIAYGKTAYVNGSKITGTHECSGGSSVNVETCTVVTLPFDYNSTARYVGYDLTVVNDGVITVWSEGSGTPINNVVCGSLLYIDSSMSSIGSSKFRLDGEEPYSYSPDGYILFSVPYKNGETIYITVQ